EIVRRERRTFAEAGGIRRAGDGLIEMRVRRVEVERRNEIADRLDFVAARANLALLHIEELMIRIGHADVRLRDLKHIRSDKTIRALWLKLQASLGLLPASRHERLTAEGRSAD